MNYSEIIGRIGGKKRFTAACIEARQAASDPHYGSGQASITFKSKIPGEISNLLWSSKLTVGTKLQLFMQFYEAMPCYGLLMYLKDNYGQFCEHERNQFWDWVRTQLDSNDPVLSPPIAYCLWCDFFEDPNTVHEAWSQLVVPFPSEKALQTILIHSGPVPFHLKQPVYTLLIDKPQWHYYIFQSLLHSQFDVYGKLDKRSPWKLLQQLNLPSNIEHLDKLKEKLAIDANTR